MNFKYIFMVSILLIFLAACSDDDSPNSPNEQGAKELSLKTIDIPSAMKQKADAHAQMAYGYITLANSFNLYKIYFTPPSGTRQLGKINDEWTKSWTVEGVTITYNYFENTTNFGWNVFLNGTDGEQTFNNWHFMEASEIVGTQAGSFKIYNYETNSVGSEWIYATSASDVYSMNIISYDDTNSQKAEIISNTDLSGELTYYKMGTSDFMQNSKINWNADGTGLWWEYNLDGSVANSGSF